MTQEEARDLLIVLRRTVALIAASISWRREGFLPKDAEWIIDRAKKFEVYLDEE